MLFHSHQPVEVRDDAAESIFERNFMSAGRHLALKFDRFPQVRDDCQGRGGHFLGRDEAHFLAFGCYKSEKQDFHFLPFFLAWGTQHKTSQNNREPCTRQKNYFLTSNNNILSVSRSRENDAQDGWNDCMSTGLKRNSAKSASKWHVPNRYHSALILCRKK